MYPMRVGIEEGTLDIKEYDFNKDLFIGSNDKKYQLKDIKYFIIPQDEIKKILKKNNISQYETMKPSKTKQKEN